MSDRYTQANWVDWFIGVSLFVFLSSVYYATVSGITSSNDGSHYALIRTVVENRSFALLQFDDFAEGNDIAISEDGRLFSDRPPGTALIGALFYMVGDRLPAPPGTLPSRHDGQNPLLAYVLLLPVLAGTGTAAILYALMRMLPVSRAAAATAILMAGLGTVHWKYSSVLFSHALSSLLVVLTIYLAMGIVRRGRANWLLYGFLGFLLGFAVLTEYSNFLLVIILLIYLLLNSRPFAWRELLLSLTPLVIGGLVAVLFLAAYNAANFGSPLRLSYSYAINYPWASSFATTFNFPLTAGIKGLLVGGTGDGWCDGPCPNQGLFLLSPILLFSISGWHFFYRSARRECLLTGAIFLVYLILFARHRTFHGFTADGRYLTPYLSLLAIPLAYMLQWIYSLHAHPILRATLLLSAFGLFLLSFRNQFLHIGTSYNYALDLGLLDTLAANPQNGFSLLGQVFLNTGNLALLWLLELFAALLLIITLVALHNIPLSPTEAGD